MGGVRKKLKFDPELLYIGAMFHDIGLSKEYSSATERFEVDSANAARDFLRQHGIDEPAIDVVLHRAPHYAGHPSAQEAGSSPGDSGRRDGRPRTWLPRRTRPSPGGGSPRTSARGSLQRSAYPRLPPCVRPQTYDH